MDTKFHSNRLLSGVPADQLASLEFELREHKYSPGEILFKEQSAGDELYLVASGSVRISKVGRSREQETLDIIERGDFFGEMSVLEDTPRSAQACAIEETVVGILSGSELKRLLGSVPKVSVNIGKHMIHRLRRTSEHLIDQLMESERLSLIGRMAGSIVHDLKNPLATIFMACHGLKNRATDPNAARIANAIQESAHRMQLMTEELLDYSKGISRVALHTTTVERLMTPLEEDVLARLRHRGIEVVKNLGYTGAVTVDESRVTRLLSNIVANAADAMPDGGRLEISTALNEKHLLFHISDTGRGMSEEVAHRIFEPFFTNGKESGTGLGMAIAKSVIDAHHGRIWLESEPGSGTTFHIELPLEPAMG